LAAAVKASLQNLLCKLSCGVYYLGSASLPNLATHIADYTELTHAFTLDIGQGNNATAIALPTDQLINEYDIYSGSPLLEYLVYR
jgi:hypothetical protein